MDGFSLGGLPSFSVHMTATRGQFWKAAKIPETTHMGNILRTGPTSYKRSILENHKHITHHTSRMHISLSVSFNNRVYDCCTLKQFIKPYLAKA